MPSIIISILALLATFYQLYLQRIHNEKSLKPLVQINLTDENGLLYIHIQNNGVGPFIAEKLIFIKDGKEYFNIKDCLSLSYKFYQQVPVSASVKKVVPPGTYLEVFSKQFGIAATESEIDEIRKQLAVLNLKVEGRDIYNNKISTDRDLHWFLRHHTS